MQTDFGFFPLELNVIITFCIIFCLTPPPYCFILSPDLDEESGTLQQPLPISSRFPASLVIPSTFARKRQSQRKLQRESRGFLIL